MSTYTGPERRAPEYRWITDTVAGLAEMADIRSPWDAFCFGLCGASVAALVLLAIFPREFYALVMGWFS